MLVPQFEISRVVGFRDPFSVVLSIIQIVCMYQKTLYRTWCSFTKGAPKFFEKRKEGASVLSFFPFYIKTSSGDTSHPNPLQLTLACLKMEDSEMLISLCHLNIESVGSNYRNLYLRDLILLKEIK